MRGGLLPIAIGHPVVVVDGGRGELVLVVVVVEHVVLLDAPVLHLRHEVVDSGAAAACRLQREDLLLVLEGLRVDVVHAALRKICRRGQVADAHVCRVVFGEGPRGLIVDCEGLVGCRSALAVVFLFRT